MKPSEFETVAYLVVPLLRHLGWTPQRMAVEWNRIDVALFDAMPRANDNLAVAVEAKKRDDSCLSARGQAEGYASLSKPLGLRWARYRTEAPGQRSRIPCPWRLIRGRLQSGSRPPISEVGKADTDGPGAGSRIS